MRVVFKGTRQSICRIFFKTKNIVVKEDRSSPAEAKQTESDLLSGAEVPPPPAPHVKATLDALLASMKNGELDEGEKHPEEYVSVVFFSLFFLICGVCCFRSVFCCCFFVV
jgi:hypothetical protein